MKEGPDTQYWHSMYVCPAHLDRYSRVDVSTRVPFTVTGRDRILHMHATLSWHSHVSERGFALRRRRSGLLSADLEGAPWRQE